MNTPQPPQTPQPGDPQGAPQIVYVQQQKKGGCVKWGAIVLGVLILLGIVVGMMSGGDDKGDGSDKGTSTGAAAVVDDTPAIEVTAEAYASAYNTNEIAADNEYKGKKLHITGTLSRVSETAGTYYVYMDTDLFESVSCRLEKSELDKAATLTPGQAIGLTGIGNGYDGFSVQVKNCVID